MSSLSVKALCEFFWDLENRHGLLDLKIEGVYVWQCLRMDIYYEIAKASGLFSQHTSPAYPKMGFKAKLIQLVNSLVTQNPFLRPGRREVLVFTHPRKKSFKGAAIDLYTHHFVEELQSKGVSYEAYERGYSNRDITQEKAERAHLEIFTLIERRLSPLIKVRLNSEQRSVTNRVSEDIKRDFGVSLDLDALFIMTVKRFKVHHALYRILLRVKRPERIYLVVNYGVHAPLIMAAKDEGIQAIELQHGTFSTYHLGYSFPGRSKELAYFPSEFWVWDEFWKGMCELPVPAEKVRIYPFHYMKHEKEAYLSVERKRNHVLVISQGAIGRKLADFIRRQADELKDWQITYKLHPGEAPRWREDRNLVKLSEYPNVKIADADARPLYQLFAESTVVVGVFSTAVFEGLDFGCRIVLLDLPGIEYMTNLINVGKAVLVKEGESLDAALKNAVLTGELS